jgi:hypothetical protein
MAYYLDQFRDPSTRLFVPRADLATGALYLDRYTDAFPEVLEDTITIEASGVTHVRGQALAGGRLLVTYTQGTDVKARISEDGGDTWEAALTIATGADGSDAWFAEEVGLLVVATHHTVMPFGPHRWDFWVGELDSAGALTVTSGPFSIVTAAPQLLPIIGRLLRSPNGIWWFIFKTNPTGNVSILRCRSLNATGGTWSFEVTVTAGAAPDGVDLWFAEELGMLVVPVHVTPTLPAITQWLFYTAGANSAGALALTGGPHTLVVSDDPHGRLMRDAQGIWRFVYTDNLGVVTMVRCRDLFPASPPDPGGTFS